MKISKQTLDLLKNYSHINSNILIREGNVVSTVSVGNTIFSRAVVEEEFPVEFAIYDLNSLLSLLTLSDDQDVDFGENSLTVSKDGGTFEFHYADPSIIVAAPNKEIVVDPFFEFSLTGPEITMIQKAASITSSTTLSIIGDGETATLLLNDPKNSGSNTYRKVLGQTEDVFNSRLSMDSFKVMNDGYTVGISKKKFMHFKSTTKDLQYWIALTDFTFG